MYQSLSPFVEFPSSVWDSLRDTDSVGSPPEVDTKTPLFHRFA
jgi:hypothetical protein